MQGLYERHEKVKARAYQTRLQMTKQADHLRAVNTPRIAAGFKPLGPDGKELPKGQKPKGWRESLMYGFVDGMAGGFDKNCQDAMYGVINGAARSFEYSSVYKPNQTVKFQLGLTTFTESLNSVYTFCDFTAFFNNFEMYADYANWEQYIQIGSRIGGSLISQIPTYRECIQQGLAGANGFDVGICSGKIISTVMDTKL